MRKKSIDTFYVDSETVRERMTQMGFSKSDLTGFWKKRLSFFGATIETTVDGDFKFEKYKLPNGRIHLFVTPIGKDNGN